MIYIENIACWAPGLTTSEDWAAFADGSKLPLLEKTSPALEYTESNFRRRLSQISRMTIQVVHQLFTESNLDRLTKLTFISLRGEIERELKVNKTLIEDNSILPASFSLSVFNTPIAQATIAEELKGGYNAIYPSQNNFRDGFLEAVSPVLCGKEKKLVLVYADELVPGDYEGFMPEENVPLAFALTISQDESNGGIMLPLENITKSPVEFLKTVLKARG